MANIMSNKTLIERKEYLKGKDYFTIMTIIYDWTINGEINIDEFRKLLEYTYQFLGIKNAV